MTNFIPIFPLGIVVYPGESLNLHIFEPRYKELINECYAENKPFGIPVVLKNGVAELGTLVAIKEIVEVYADGKMDIKTKGIQVFRILETIKPAAGKLFSGAIVNYPDNNETHHTKMMQQVVENIRQLHGLLKVDKDFKKPDDELLSYDVAHHAGLSLEEEYELLGLLNELQRLEYLKRHLKIIISAVNNIEGLKEKIQLNGHFKEMKGFNFDIE